MPRWVKTAGGGPPAGFAVALPNNSIRKHAPTQARRARNGEPVRISDDTMELSDAITSCRSFGAAIPLCAKGGEGDRVPQHSCGIIPDRTRRPSISIANGTEKVLEYG